MHAPVPTSLPSPISRTVPELSMLPRLGRLGSHCDRSPRSPPEAETIVAKATARRRNRYNLAEGRAAPTAHGTAAGSEVAARLEIAGSPPHNLRRTNGIRQPDGPPQAIGLRRACARRRPCRRRERCSRRGPWWCRKPRGCRKLRGRHKLRGSPWPWGHGGPRSPISHGCKCRTLAGLGRRSAQLGGERCWRGGWRLTASGRNHGHAPRASTLCRNPRSWPKACTPEERAMHLALMLPTPNLERESFRHPTHLHEDGVCFCNLPAQLRCNRPRPKKLPIRQPNTNAHAREQLAN